jgi:hypothetical protein
MGMRKIYDLEKESTDRVARAFAHKATSVVVLVPEDGSLQGSEKKGIQLVVPFPAFK